MGSLERSGGYVVDVERAWVQIEYEACVRSPSVPPEPTFLLLYPTFSTFARFVG